MKTRTYQFLSKLASVCTREQNKRMRNLFANFAIQKETLGGRSRKTACTSDQ